jgi:LPXTG-motif cell wall-anchored protein
MKARKRRKKARNFEPVITAGILGLASTVLGIGASIWGSSEADKARKKQQAAIKKAEQQATLAAAQGQVSALQAEAARETQNTQYWTWIMYGGIGIAVLGTGYFLAKRRKRS